MYEDIYQLIRRYFENDGEKEYIKDFQFISLDDFADTIYGFVKNRMYNMHTSDIVDRDVTKDIVNKTLINYIMDTLWQS